MDNPKQQIIERLKKANNVLVTVSNNPSVDQLAACIGLSLALNKLDKHATAVYSGETPSTIEFLKPEETLEKTTDSLRDFIISLDKSKADKLRYKVEENVVRIFITPYRTSISDKDLEFSQGDFNVDVVVAIGVHEQKELDQAITAHGRILHDATIVTVNNTDGGDLGGVNWNDKGASSLSEMAATLTTELGTDVLDSQIATALLTGIVAETDRFSNEKTSANTMNTSAALMAAGANQQLVASKLQEPSQPSANTDISASAAVEGDSTASEQSAESEDGTLTISHRESAVPDTQEPSQQPIAEPPKPENDFPEIIKKTGELPRAETHDGVLSGSYQNPRTAVSTDDPSKIPPFSSAMSTESPEEETSPINLPPVEDHIKAPSVQPLAHDNQTLEEIEKDVHSTHLEETPVDKTVESTPASQTAHPPEELDLADLQRPSGIDEGATEKADIDAAREAVAKAMADTETQDRLEPIKALNAQPLGDNLHSTPAPAANPDSAQPPVPSLPPDPTRTADQPMTMPLPPVPPAQSTPGQNNTTPPNPSSAPPVPPPILPPPYSGQ
jgi:nanoRNase/pAp phosphatase (c-di-AMP/oligoRNAs hydrolase)